MLSVLHVVILIGWLLQAVIGRYVWYSRPFVSAIGCMIKRDIDWLGQRGWSKEAGIGHRQVKDGRCVGAAGVCGAGVRGRRGGECEGR